MAPINQITWPEPEPYPETFINSTERNKITNHYFFFLAPLHLECTLMRVFSRFVGSRSNPIKLLNDHPVFDSRSNSPTGTTRTQQVRLIRSGNRYLHISKHPHAHTSARNWITLGRGQEGRHGSIGWVQIRAESMFEKQIYFLVGSERKCTMGGKWWSESNSGTIRSRRWEKQDKIRADPAHVDSPWVGLIKFVFEMLGLLFFRFWGMINVRMALI